MIELFKWFMPWWWNLLLEPPKGEGRWESFWCRAGGHKAGVVFYNPCGLEPDMRCRGCSDDLG